MEQWQLAGFFFLIYVAAVFGYWLRTVEQQSLLDFPDEPECDTPESRARGAGL